MVQILGDESFGGKLGKALGTGLSSGLQTLAQMKLQDHLETAKQRRAETTPFALEEIPTSYGKLAGKEALLALERGDYESIQKRANDLVPFVGRERALSLALDEFENPLAALETEEAPAATRPPLPPKGGFQAVAQNLKNKGAQTSPIGDTVGKTAKKGAYASVGGRAYAIANGVPYEEYQKSISAPNQGFLQDLGQQVGHLAADAPLYAAGYSLGAAGGPRTGAATSMALPAFADKALEEYHEYKSSGGTASFDKFVHGLARASKAGAIGAAEGYTMARAGELIKYVKKIPGAEKLFQSGAAGNIAEKGAQAALQTTGAVGARSALEGKIPTTQDWGNTFVQVLGLNLLHGKYSAASEKKLSSLYGEGKTSPPPERVAQEIQKVAQEKGYDLNKPNQATKAINETVRRFEKATPSLEGEKATRVFKETEVEAPTRRQQVVNDIEEYVKRRPGVQLEILEERQRSSKPEATKRETTLAKEKQVVENASQEFESAQSRYKTVQKSLSSAKDELSLKRRQKASQEELSNLETKVERLKSQVEDSAENLKKIKYEKSTGREYLSDRRIQEMAENDARNLQEKLKNKSIDEIVKSDPLEEKLSEKIAKSRELPGTESLPKDTYTRIQEAYRDAYERRLGQVESQLKVAEGQKRAELAKEKEALGKLIDRLKSKRMIHRRRQSLREVDKIQRRHERLKAAEKKASDEITSIVDQVLSKGRPETLESTTSSSPKEALSDAARPDNQASSKNDIKLDLTKLNPTAAIQKAFAKRGIKISAPMANLLIKSAFGATGASVPLTIAAFYKTVADIWYAHKAKGMTKPERMKYYKQLKLKGVTTKRISAINKAAQTD